MELKICFKTIEGFRNAVRLFKSDLNLKKFDIDTDGGRSLIVHEDAAPLLWKKGVVCGVQVEAREDDDYDGAWVTCPFCEQENGVSWDGDKECSLCKQALIVMPSPLVKPRPDEEMEQWRKRLKRLADGPVSKTRPE